MKTYAWAKINRKSKGLGDIYLENVTVTESPIDGLVVVTGQENVFIEEKLESQLPTKKVNVPLPWWHPSRIFLRKSIKIIEVPNTDGWEEYWYNFAHQEWEFARYEKQQRTYQIHSVWLELSEK